MSIKLSSFYSLLIIFIFVCSSCGSNGQDIRLVRNGTSEYVIVIPAKPIPVEEKAANVLAKYIRQISGVDIEIVKEERSISSGAIFIGNTKAAANAHFDKLLPAAFLLKARGKNIIIQGGAGKGVLFGVYTFIENYLGCRKPADGPAIVPNKKSITIPADLDEEQAPDFHYREAYYPASHDEEYLYWHKLHKFEDLWGIWGHSFNKLMPPDMYFSTHPEYYSMVKGKRQPSQLCLSNEEVFKKVIKVLKTKIADNQDALFWSISPNDDNNYCQCDDCKAVDEREGSPSGSLIRFVNKVAKEFPDSKFTTLAYGYSHAAPERTKPAPNVYIMLSDIDAFRDKPLKDEGTASAFVNDLKEWKAITDHIFVWDYVTQFTNYLAPFPNFHTLQANLQYLKDNGVKGVFAQGSGDTRSEWSELRSYVLAKLLWNTKRNVNDLVAEFMNQYYGEPSAKFLTEYIDDVTGRMKESKRKLDIYGNPINEWNGWLTPQLLREYGKYFDNAEAAAAGNATYLERLATARLPLEYTAIQQSKFFGIEDNGIFVKNRKDDWVIRENLKERVVKFILNCKNAGVTELSEGGPSPDQYLADWDSICRREIIPTKALGAAVTLKFPYAENIGSKGNRTLVDGVAGYEDYSYNWLLFYGVPMVATIDLGKAMTVKNVIMHFLDDPRHWIFTPESIQVEGSKDGKTYKTISSFKPGGKPEEHMELTFKEFDAENKTKDKVRFIRVTANNLKTLPLWRFRENKKPTIACDEIYVQ
jgi:Domain of unknown function (DUF4838)